jgi:hypothetical protein
LHIHHKILAKEADKKVLQSAEKMKALGYIEEINSLLAAYKMKDIVWSKAQTIIKKIQQGDLKIIRQ